MSETTSPSPEPQLEVIVRPEGQLHDYPVEVRWEVTRRHPDYLVFWSQAQLYHRNQLGDHPAQAQLGYIAMLILGAIGVGGELVSPEKSFEELFDGQPDPAFLSGSCQPVTFRAVVAMLVHGLPPDESAAIGELLMARDDSQSSVPGTFEGPPLTKEEALGLLAKLRCPTLDSYPDIPLFYVHLGASQRSITRDVEDQVRRWKARRGLPEKKIHTAKLRDYLAVWDLREGWTKSGYDLARESSFAEVGRRLKIGSISTVAHRYKLAFQMITGHPFSPALWWRLFGPLKYSTLLGDPAPSLSAPMRHHLRSPASRPVPESVVSPPAGRAHTSGTVEGESAIRDDHRLTDLLVDLQDLIGRGRTDEEIARELELPDASVVAELRERIDDFRSL